MTKIKKWYSNLPIQLKASFWFLMCSFLQRGVAVITTPVFTRLLSTEQYGNYDVFHSWMSIVSIIVTLNLFGGFYQRGLIKHEDERNILSSSMQGMVFSLCTLWTIIYLIFNNFWNNLLSLTTPQVLMMLFIIWMNAVFNFWAAEQRVRLKYKTLVFISLSISIIQPIICILLIVNAEDKVLARILGIAIASLVGYCWMFVFQMIRGKKFFSSKFWKSAILFNIPLLPHYLSQTILNNSDRIMIKQMVGEESAGIYGLAYALSQIMILFNVALSDTMGPWIYKKIKDNEINDISKVAYSSMVIIAAVNIALIAFAPEAVFLFAPEEYHEAIWCIPPIAMSVFFLFTYDLFAKFEFYYKKTKLISIATFIGAAVNILTNFIFIRIFGYIAAAYTTLFCYMLYSFFHFCAMKYVCRKELQGACPYNTKILILITSSFLIVGFLFLFTYNFPIVRYSLAGAMLILLAIFSKRIIKAIKSLLSIKQSANTNNT